MYFWPPCFWRRPFNFWRPTVAGIPAFDITVSGVYAVAGIPADTGALPAFNILSVAVVSVPAVVSGLVVVCFLLLLVSLLIPVSLMILALVNVPLIAGILA